MRNVSKFWVKLKHVVIFSIQDLFDLMIKIRKCIWNMVLEKNVKNKMDEGTKEW
jgi:hypothetical protein